MPGEETVVFPDATMERRAPETAACGIRERLPVIGGWTVITQAGALASFGPDLDEAYDLLGMQAVRILRGADASAMAIERPTRVRATVNMKTAQALHVTVPPALVARADII